MYFEPQLETQTAYLLLGSNTGNRKAFLERACLLTAEIIGPIRLVSSVFETEPWGFQAETSFLNQALMVETELPAESLLKEILRIEAELGRVRNAGGYESRCIDIDILFYGKAVLKSETLTVPHPLLQARRFALLPMDEIAPDLQHPLLGMTIHELLALCADTGKVWKYAERKG